MNKEEYTISPWMQLLVRRLHARKVHRWEWLRHPIDVERAIRKKRKEYLGSDLSIEMFVRDRDGPNEEAIRELGKYLATRTAAFLKEEGWEEICETFFHYSLYMMASGQIGEECIDDLIQLGDCYEKHPETFAIVGEAYLEDEMLQELQEWVTENEWAPPNFGTAVLGAVAVLMGVLDDPLEE